MRRNRAQGWKHAKLSGHSNEELVKQYILANKESFAERLQIAPIKSVEIGGLHEHTVASILGDTTKTKGDLFIETISGQQLNISIKKSWGGQVYLITLDRFLKGLKALYNIDIEENTHRAFELFFGYECTDKVKAISTQHKQDGIITPKIHAYQLRKHRLTLQSLQEVNPIYPDLMLKWIKDNIEVITRFCFSSGLVQDNTHWANYVWYINLLGEDDVDEIYSIEQIVNAVKENKDMIVFGTHNGGTTITLPFGFVQWHQHKMQFHHRLQLIQTILPHTSI